MTNGVVYTRKWVVDLVLDMAGCRLGSEILTKKIIEPSCGQGAFTKEIAFRLAESVRTCGGTWSQLGSCVQAFDVDEESLAIARQGVVTALVDGGCPDGCAEDIAAQWFRCDDFLLADVEPADTIVGNPPYIRGTELERSKRSEYCAFLESMTAGCDLYVGFIEKGMNILKESGKLCYICADRWLQNSYGRKLRRKVGSEYNLAFVVRMYGIDAFEAEVDAYPAITLVEKQPPSACLRFVNCKASFAEGDVASLEEALGNPEESSSGVFEVFDVPRPTGTGVYPLADGATVKFVTESQSAFPTIEETGIELGIGIATGCDDVFMTENPNLVEESRILPLFYMRDARRGKPDRRRYLVNPWDDNGNPVDLDDYPRLKSYFESNRDRLEKRHVAKGPSSCWYRTIDKVHLELMDRDLLLMPDMASMPDPVLSRGKYPHHNCYWISSDIWDLEVLGGLLMADTTRRFVDALGVKMRGGTLRFQAQYLRLLHVPPYEAIRNCDKDELRSAYRKRDRDMATRCAEAVYVYTRGES